MTKLRPLCRGAVAAVVVVLAVPTGPIPAWGQEPILVIDGRGWGHGVGMSQEGARTMGAAGSSADEILATFYPGTVKAAAMATLRVLVLESAQRSETLGFPSGGEIRASPSGSQPAGFPVVVGPGGTVEVSRDSAGYHVATRGPNEWAAPTGAQRLRLISAEGPGPSTIPSLPGRPAAMTTTSLTTIATSLTTTTTGPPTTTTGPATTTTGPGATTTTTTLLPTPSPPSTASAAPAPAPAAKPFSETPATASTVVLPPRPTAPGPLWAVPRADGTVATSRSRRYRGAIEVGAGSDGTLRLVNHVDSESYLRGMGEVLDPRWPPAALRAQAIAARTYALRSPGAELCDDDRCQVYLGQSAEYAAMDKAVVETRGQVLQYGGRLASTFYSANGGGISATADEGFGPGGATYPYLTSATYPSADPNPWTQRPGLAEIGRRLAYTGQVSGARVSSTGPSGRATEVTIEGDAGPMSVTGRSFASRLGLQSMLFSLRSEVGEAIPLPEIDGRAIVARDMDGAGGAGLGADTRVAAVAVPPARTPGSWLRRQRSGFLLLLVADMLLMASRARSKARAPSARAPRP